MTNAIASFGTLVKIGDGGSSETFTTIAELRDISGPSFSLATVDVTPQTATGAWREFVATLLDAGEVTFDINFIPTENTHDVGAGLIKDMKNRTNRNFQVVWSDTGSTTWTLSTYITGFSPTAPVDGELSASITLKITGEPTIT